MHLTRGHVHALREQEVGSGERDGVLLVDEVLRVGSQGRAEHRHHRTNLFLYTQDYKFVDVYPRRLARYNVYTIARWLNLTLEMPRPNANSETGELGQVDLFSIRLIVRPWRDLDYKVPWPSWWKLFRNLSRRVTAHYTTHAPHLLDKASKKNPPDAPAGAARSASADRTAQLPF